MMRRLIVLLLLSVGLHAQSTLKDADFEEGDLSDLDCDPSCDSGFTVESSPAQGSWSVDVNGVTEGNDTEILRNISGVTDFRITFDYQEPSDPSLTLPYISGRTSAGAESFRIERVSNDKWRIEDRCGDSPSGQSSTTGTTSNSVWHTIVAERTESELQVKLDAEGFQTLSSTCTDTIENIAFMGDASVGGHHIDNILIEDLLGTPAPDAVRRRPVTF